MKRETLHRIKGVSDSLDVPVNEEQVEARLEQLKERAKRARQRKIALAAAALVLLGLGVGFGARTLWEPSTVQPSYVVTSAKVTFSDGSVVVPEASTELSVLEATPQRVRINMGIGRAKFVVTPNPSRPFEIQTDQVLVRVLGTSFDVVRTPSHVTVDVAHGKVAVIGPAGKLILGAGQHAQVPAKALRADAPTSVVPNPPSQARSNQGLSFDEEEVERLEAMATNTFDDNKPLPKPKHPPLNTWRALAKRGEHEQAAVWLRQHKVVPKTPENLMLAADTFRLVGDPKGALNYLHRLTTKYPKHASTPLAYFTQGRILSDKLGQHAKAAQMFAKVTHHHPTHSLAEHALAREARSWFNAGDLAQAKLTSTQYLKRYPNGPRVNFVKAYASP